MSIRDVAIRKINGGFIVSHYSVPDKPKEEDDDGPCCMPMGKSEEDFFTSEAEAGQRVAALAKDLKPNGRF